MLCSVSNPDHPDMICEAQEHRDPNIHHCGIDRHRSWIEADRKWVYWTNKAYTPPQSKKEVVKPKAADVARKANKILDPQWISPEEIKQMLLDASIRIAREEGEWWTHKTWDWADARGIEYDKKEVGPFILKGLKPYVRDTGRKHVPDPNRTNESRTLHVYEWKGPVGS